MNILRRFSQFVGFILGLIILLSIASIFAYWIGAFVYFGMNGSFAGLDQWISETFGVLRDLRLNPGPLTWTDWRSVAFHAVGLFGPGVLVLIPSYLTLRLFEVLAPR